MKNLSENDVRALEDAGWNKSRIGWLQDHLALRKALPVYTIEVAQRFANGRLCVLECVSSMIQMLDPTNGELPVLYAAAHAIRRNNTQPSQGPGKGRSPVWSVPLEDVPEHEIALIMKWCGSIKRRQEMIYTLRQVYGAARRAGSPEVFDMAALTAFRLELSTRGLRAKSIAIAMDNCLRIGNQIGMEEGLSVLIRNEMNSEKQKASRQPSKRRSDYRSNPVTPLDYARKARKVSMEAHASTAGRQTRHRLFVTAGLLAFLSWMPDRISDVLGLVVGRDISRDKKGWQLEYHAQKTGHDMALPSLPAMLTPYLDDLILFGADPGFGGEVLDQLYRQRKVMKSPLFARVGLHEAYSPIRVFQLIKAETGHGPHAARKSISDYCAEVRMPIEDAMALLGHSSRKTTEEHYEVFADRHRRAHTQEKLTGLRGELADKEDAFRTPGGKLIDITRINARLSLEAKRVRLHQNQGDRGLDGVFRTGEEGRR